MGLSEPGSGSSNPDLAMNSDEFVMVPVPKDKVLQVMRFLAGGPAGSSEGAPEVRAEPTHEAEPPAWDEENLYWLVLEAQDKQVRMLTLLAQRAGEWVSAGEMAEHLGLRGRAVGGVTKSLIRRCRYYDNRDLPFTKEWRHDLGNSYKMEPTEAVAILPAVAKREQLHREGRSIYDEEPSSPLSDPSS